MFHPPQGSPASQRYLISPSDKIVIASDAEVSTGNTSATECKRIKINMFGTIRTYFELRSYSSYSAWGFVGRNSRAIGTQRSTTSTSYVAFTEDIDGWMEGDNYQLYLWVITSGNYAYARNFRANGTLQVLISPPVGRVEPVG